VCKCSVVSAYFVAVGLGEVGSWKGDAAAEELLILDDVILDVDDFYLLNTLTSVYSEQHDHWVLLNVKKCP